MTERSRDPYEDMEPDAGTERGSEERRVSDPADRAVPFVDGPTGAAPLSSELRGDPYADGDERTETGAKAAVIKGTSLAGPIGGVVGGLLGGVAGTGSEDDQATDARLEAEDARTKEAR